MMKNLIEEIIATRNPNRFKFLSDKTYLSLRYKYIFKKKVNWENPITFNEKLQWLKLYDKRPEYTKMVDKYEVKQYISKVLNGKYIIPTLGIWNSFEEIDFNMLPNQFVLKCTHDSGGLIVCRDKETLDFEKARKKINQSLQNNYFYSGREWPYKNVRPRIIAEQFMADDFRDYKLFFNNDVPRMKLVYSVRLLDNQLIENFYDEVWKYCEEKKQNNCTDIFKIQRSSQYNLMKELTVKLSEKLSFSRIDYYEIDEKNYWGEITFQSLNVFEDFKPDEWNFKLGEWSKLSNRGAILNSEDCAIVISNSYYNNKDVKALVDYKFFCFNGVAESVMVCTERETGRPKFYFFNKEWKLKKYNILGKEAPQNFMLPKPDCMDEMFSIAEKLSEGIPYVRVDLYCVDDLIYFGEMTFYPDSGFDANLLPEAEKHWGEMLVLPEKRK